MTTHSPVPLLLTVQEVSKLLRIHRPKVYDLIRANIIEGFKLGSDWRVKRESLERLTGPIPHNFFSSKKSAAEMDDAVEGDEKGTRHVRAQKRNGQFG